MCCSVRFRVRRQSAEKNCQSGTVRQPILRWGTICFELCAGFKYPVALHKCGSYVFIFNKMPIQIAGCDKEKIPRSQSLEQMHDKDTEGETKSICSCVFYPAWRSYLGSDRPHQACPAAWSFLGKRWAGSASLETGIQVGLVTVCGVSEEWCWTTITHLPTEERRVDLW